MLSSSNNPLELNGEFLEEYKTEASVRKYTKETAGQGIGYLLDHDYGKIYLEALSRLVPQSGPKTGIRLWEFGCGAGMNLLHLVRMIERLGIPLESAIGTDFSDTLIEAAKLEAERDLTPEQHKKVQFCVARHENLIDDVSHSRGVSKDSLLGSVDLMLGVNTARYCHRLGKENEYAGAIFDVLAEGGLCVVIDMNDRFPVFRSRFRDRLAKRAAAYYLPSLDEYAKPFLSAGFDILRKENFCWIPHSAGSGLTAVMKTLTPVLNAFVPTRAMRSLVIAQKNTKRDGKVKS